MSASADPVRAGPALIASVAGLCVLIYLGIAFTHGEVWTLPAAALLAAGGSAAPALAAGEVWRLLSAIVLHGSLMHLGANLLAWAEIARRMRRAGGSAGTILAVVVVAGMGGFVLSAVGQPQTVSVGLSGGLLGAVGWLMVREGRADRPIREYAVWLLLLAGLGLFMPEVDHLAHAGGLLTGAGLAALPPPRFGTGGVGLAVGLLLLPLAFPVGWSVSWREAERFEHDYRDFARLDAELAGYLRVLGERSRSPEGLLRSEALTVLTSELFPRLEVARGPWQQAYETGWIEGERQLLLRYLALRGDTLSALYEAIDREDPAALARFERARQDAEAVERELGDAARLARREAERSVSRAPP